MTAPKLKPCPWHPANSYEHIAYTWGKMGFGYVECLVCGSHGPIAATKSAAIKAWNRRKGGDK
jgi:hypothetical protein